MRRSLMTLAALLAGAPGLSLATSPARADEQGGGTRIGGSVASTLSLDLRQTGATVRAVVTTTEPDSRLSVAPSDGRSGLSATVSGPYAPLDPAFGLTLVAWDDVLAGRATTLRLRSASRAASTVLITLSATTP
ncbi:MAG TPA: hypothetical protein VFG42_26165 [Baekduia sp.]|uniref:hypothetical protein n=1 Tax=Baekduia sp. TaxID=2600305 RepID=UPI002D76ABB7|nr:hypothetical protein [Baekduia sp.]HET6510306.1 hypothetical protein [Baekduia sp.]